MPITLAKDAKPQEEQTKETQHTQPTSSWPFRSPIVSTGRIVANSDRPKTSQNDEGESQVSN